MTPSLCAFCDKYLSYFNLNGSSYTLSVETFCSGCTFFEIFFLHILAVNISAISTHCQVFLLQQLKINIIVIVNILIIMIADFFLLIIVTIIIIVMITIIIIIIIIGGRYLSTQAANLGVQASGKSSLL